MTQAGFTLMELMVTMVIAVVIASIALPIYRNQDDGANETALLADLKLAATLVEEGIYDGTVTPGTTDIPPDSPNVGAYSTHAVMVLQVNQPETPGGPIEFCIRAEYKDQTMFWESTGVKGGYPAMHPERCPSL